jgi:hypothetical protein
MIYIYTHLIYFFFTTFYWYSLKLLTESFIFKQNSLWKGIWKKILFSVHRACIYILCGLPNGDFYSGKYSRAPNFAAIFQFFFLATPPPPWVWDTPYHTLPHSSFPYLKGNTTPGICVEYKKYRKWNKWRMTSNPPHPPLPDWNIWNARVNRKRHIIDSEHPLPHKIGYWYIRKMELCFYEIQKLAGRDILCNWSGEKWTFLPLIGFRYRKGVVFLHVRSKKVSRKRYKLAGRGI